MCELAKGGMFKVEHAGTSTDQKLNQTWNCSSIKVTCKVSIFQLKTRVETQQKEHCLILANTCILYNLYKMSRQLIKLKTRQKMIEDTPNSNFSSQLKV